MSQPDFYLLAYDISDDKRRAKIARIIEAAGARVQGSVFEAYLSPADLQTLIKRIKKVMKKGEDSLRVYFLCEDCRKKIQAIGSGAVTQPPDVVIL